MRHENLEEAHALNLHAVQLDPGNLAFRLNAASVLTAMDRYDEATDALRTALKMAANPNQVAMLESRLKEVETIKSLNAQRRAMDTAPPTGQVDIQTGGRLATSTQGQSIRRTSPDGPKHMAVGVIRGVQCSYPAVIEFHLETVKKPVSRLQ